MRYSNNLLVEIRNADDFRYKFSKSITQTSSGLDFIPVRVVSKTRNVPGNDKSWDTGNISDKALRTNRILLPNEGRQTRRKKRLRRRKRKQRRRSKSLGPKVRKNNLLSELEGLGQKKELYEKIIKSYIKQRVRRRKKKLRSKFSSKVPLVTREDTEHTQQSLAGVLDLPLQGQTLPGLGEAGEAGAGQGALPEELEAPGRHRPHRPAPLGRRPPERELAGEGGLRPEGLQAEGVERQVAGQAGWGH